MPAVSITTTIDVAAIAHEAVEEPDFCIELLAELADRKQRVIKSALYGNSGSEWHQNIPNFLRELADALEKQNKES